MQKPSQLANLKAPWKPGEAPKSPGRPPLPDVIKEARRVLKDASLEAAVRLREIVNDRRDRDGLHAAVAILSKTLPTLEEVTTNEHPLPEFDDKLLETRLRILDAKPSSDNPGTGVAA